MALASTAVQLKKVMSVSKGIEVLFQIGIALWGIGMAFTLVGLFNSSSLQLNVGNGDFGISFPKQEVQQLLIHVKESPKVWGLSFRYESTAIEPAQLKTAATPLLRTLAGIAFFLGSAVVMNLLNQLAKLFSNYAKGEIFTDAVVRCIRKIGYAVIGFPLLALLNSVLATTLVSQIAPEAHWIDVFVNFGTILIAVVVLLISWIMDVGRAMREENDLVI